MACFSSNIPASFPLGFFSTEFVRQDGNSFLEIRNATFGVRACASQGFNLNAKSGKLEISNYRNLGGVKYEIAIDTDADLQITAYGGGIGIADIRNQGSRNICIFTLTKTEVAVNLKFDEVAGTPIMVLDFDPAYAPIIVME